MASIVVRVDNGDNEDALDRMDEEDEEEEEEQKKPKKTLTVVKHMSGVFMCAFVLVCVVVVSNVVVA